MESPPIGRTGSLLHLLDSDEHRFSAGERPTRPMGALVSSANSLATEDLGSAAQRDRRKRILDTTIALASQGGFEAVQMRAVAEQADVALGTLYRYFPSKIHLLVSALAREFEQANATIDRRPIPGETPHERVMYVL